MSHGVMTGGLLTGLITGNIPPWAELYDSSRLQPAHEAVATAKSLTAIAGHYIGDRVRSAPYLGCSEKSPT
jgi:hypothetical protein